MLQSSATNDQSESEQVDEVNHFETQKAMGELKKLHHQVLSGSKEWKKAHKSDALKLVNETVEDYKVKL